jgi:hypothetical protein
LLSLVEGERGFTGRLTEDRVVGRLRAGNHYLTTNGQRERRRPAALRRLLVPQNAIAGSGVRRNVFVVHNGRIVARSVKTIDPTERGVPIEPASFAPLLSMLGPS